MGVNAGDPYLINQRQLDSAVKFIREHTKFHPHIALILGSGLGDFADQLNVTSVIPTSEIPYYPRSTVQGHEGKLVFGYISSGSKKSPPLLVFKGRVHFYETGKLASAMFPVHVTAGLGAKSLIVTNAAGGINRRFTAGDLMLIRDVIDLTFTKSIFKHNSKKKSPHAIEWLRGGFKDLFDAKMMSVIRRTSDRIGLELQEGTYCWLKGPTYETAAEIEMLRRIGADAVGMSTVPEVLIALSLGMKVAGISLISNLATGITGEKLSHAEVTKTADRVKQGFTFLMKQILLSL